MQTLDRNVKPDVGQSYDFRRPIQMSKGFERNMNMVADSFTKLVTLSLNNYLRMPVSVRSHGARQVLFEEFTSGISNPSCINILGLSPLKVPGILEIELSLVLTMVEKLLGGRFLGQDLSREFTAIENRIVRKIILRILESLEDAMLRLLKVEASLSAIEHNPDFTYIMNSNDPCLLLQFDIELGDYQGHMNFCVSLSSLDAELGGDGSAGFRDVRSSEERARDEDRIRGVLQGTPTELAIEVGRIPLPFEEILKLEVGQVFNLRKLKDEALLARSGDCPLFLGSMGRNQKKVAFKISHLLQKEAKGENGEQG
ncbi:MAG: FliM/FliN family flagellar motor switch protein [Candidatus Krumholzibacteria bacterium]|jgi:flagellar motor switch protein FliM|nr:FliM/FliN family flagellar motor switch protein [Candidatus Krumholzibacteria bacterium]MDP6669855.1 FliM/FliN family flagellar motor switch protein [Candidatus Krumholzibacteria bacterium]MDP6797080.1 FliM/FliN family flagellar motor switch protein [Candidatus Krumholzibacteria bacterium]MDP7020944.1 FliM/FliN family flagellar motor switch protein [Candidatus Krumholzibacteria bacterium]